ncbi:hypothetical protein LBBP_03792 [Leptospira borgpetersenii serovar Ballum]|uniref:Uncharacterized protein n=1 Tax=Leptospira borgpetersenii serovar Ballum TaxID=280505 RepID=A0A0S2IWA7_LEPBO|nr:hypothetical protein LBBP_03792 [Leptospira borgpetersenii serovar Ballum]
MVILRFRPTQREYNETINLKKEKDPNHVGNERTITSRRN